MKKNLLKVLFMTVLFTAMFSVYVFAEEEQSGEASLAIQDSVTGNRVAKTYEISKGYKFDSTHSIEITARLYVDYQWDEGNYGWINEAYTVGEDGDFEHSSFVKSTTVVIADSPVLEDFGYKTDSLYFERYHFYGTKLHGYDLYEYVGHIWIYVQVDEWGNIDLWITFQECDGTCDDLHTRV